MFCNKCGAKLTEGAVFCQKCGAKLITDEVATQPSSIATIDSTTKPVESVTSEINETVDLLKDGLSSCSKIKSVSPAPKGNLIIMKGTIYTYIARIVNGQVKLGRGFTMPFAISIGLIVGFLTWVVFGISWDMTSGYGFNDDYTIPLAIGLFILGSFMSAICFFGEKESNTIFPYIRKALESKDVVLPTDEKLKQTYISSLVFTIIITLIGVIIFIFVIVDEFGLGSNGYSSVDAVSTTAPPQIEAASTTSPSQIEPYSVGDSILLNQTYTNENEGFSFNYPEAWIITDTFESEINAAVVLMDNESINNDNANAVLSISIIEDAYIKPIVDITEAEWLDGLEGLYGEVSILDLTKTVISDIDVIKIEYNTTSDNTFLHAVQYTYLIEQKMFVITAMSPEEMYYNYEDTFNAIMESYTITDTGTAEESSSDVAETDIVYAFESVLMEYTNNIDRYNYCDYVLYDIDKNGVDELLVRYSDGLDDYTKLYTYTNGTTNEIGEFWSRNQLLLDEDGNIYSIGSSGADNTMFEIARISDDGTAIVTTEVWEWDSIIYTYTSIDGEKAISENEYQEVSDRFFNMTTEFVDSLNWQSIFTGTGSIAKTSDTISNVGEITYNDVSLEELVIYWTIDEVSNWLGEPTYDGYYEGGRSYVFNDEILFVYDENTREIIVIGVNPNVALIDGTTLDKNRDELTALFGSPSYEGLSDGEMEDQYYYIQYYHTEYYIEFSLPDQNSATSDIMIWTYNDDAGEEEYIEPSNYIDENFEWVDMPVGSANIVAEGGWDFNLGYYQDPVTMGSVIEGTVRNISGKKFNSVQILFTLYDSQGNQVGTAFDNIANLSDGNTWKFSAPFYDDNVSTFNFEEITAY